MVRSSCITAKRLVITTALTILTIIISIAPIRAARATPLQQGTVLADSGFQMGRDNFQFPNYSTVDLPYDNLTPAEMVRMFADWPGL